MKKANKQFRRALLAAEQQKKADIKRYPLNNGVSADNEDDESITIYSDSNISIMRSANLLDPDTLGLR